MKIILTLIVNRTKGIWVETTSSRLLTSYSVVCLFCKRLFKNDSVTCKLEAQNTFSHTHTNIKLRWLLNELADVNMELKIVDSFENT